MSNTVPIIYREFYDVPRVFIVKYKQHVFLFESVFDEKTDDYSEDYDVYLMPELAEEEISGSWEKINSKATRKIGKILVSAVEFDITRRRNVKVTVLEELTAN